MGRPGIVLREGSEVNALAISPRASGAFPQPQPLRYVAILDKRLHDLGSEADPRLREDLNTRMILFGAGWSPSRLQASGVLRPAENSAPGCVSEGT
ncbi:hypothetical protein C664_13384 [Thauera sp. 63]|nr:hypothetical protein C664_13384 [Thauera sp. 63]